MMPLLGAHFVGAILEVTANQRECNNVPVLRREFQAHVKLIFEHLVVEAENGQITCFNQNLIQIVHHLSVEYHRVQQTSQVRKVHYAYGRFGTHERLQSEPVQSECTEVEGFVFLHLFHIQRGSSVVQRRENYAFVFWAYLVDRKNALVPFKVKTMV